MKKRVYNILLPAIAVILAATSCGKAHVEAKNSESYGVIYAVESLDAAAGPGTSREIIIEIGPEPGEPEETAALRDTDAAGAEAYDPETAAGGTGTQDDSQESAADDTAPQAETGADEIIASGEIVTKNGYKNGDRIGLDPAWQYAGYSVINTGSALMYTAGSGRKNRIIAVNAGHGTSGGSSVKTLCHPDGTPKVTGGSTAAGSTYATAVSTGMTFTDGTPEATVTLRMARILRDRLLAEGYDVLMIRDDTDVQLDNIARTVISNNTADIHIALHWDGDGLSTIKGVFYMSVPDALKSMEPVASHWQEHEALGDALIEGIRAQGLKIWGSNPLDTDLTQTSYSTIPSVDIELGNQCSDHSDSVLSTEAEGLTQGINMFFGF